MKQTYIPILISSIFLSLSSFGIELLTFNTGLAYTYVPYANERRPEIIKSLQSDSADVICLQEIWEKKDRKEFITKLKKEYPYSVNTSGKQQFASKSPVCKIKDLFGEDKFFTCIQTKCKAGSEDEKTECYQKQCGHALRALRDNNRECAGALMAKVGSSTTQTLISLFRPFPRTGLFAYDGEIGLLLLSKFPIVKSEIVDWKNEATLNHRAAIKANINTGNKNISVYCTHLTAKMGENVPYTGTHGDWGDENLFQVEEMIQDFENSDQETPTYMLGDFNCSFENILNDITGEFENSCQKLKDVGFVDPFTSSCTFCKKNELADSKDNLLLDHIFAKNSTIISSEVAKELPITITGPSGEVVTTNLSDHYGIRVKTEE